MRRTEEYITRLNELNKRTFFINKNILCDKQLSFAYIFYRIARPILKLNYKAFQFKHPESPWTSPASILFFKEVLNKDMVGFEYGSGRSTLFFAKKLKQLVSVEHHADWYQTVKSLLEQKKSTNVEYVFIPPDPNKSIPVNLFKEYLEHEKDFQIKTSFYDYFQYINQYPDEYFDFILVDGRARVECGLNAIKKLKKNGIFVLDNSERKRYTPLVNVLKSWPKAYTTTGLTDTTIWFKP